MPHKFQNTCSLALTEKVTLPWPRVPGIMIGTVESQCRGVRGLKLGSVGCWAHSVGCCPISDVD